MYVCIFAYVPIYASHTHIYIYIYIYICVYNTLSIYIAFCTDKYRATLTTKEEKFMAPAGQHGQMDIWLQHQNMPHSQAVMYCITSTP